MPVSFMGGQGQLNVYSYALDRESECLLTTSPLSKLILFGLLPAYQNGLSHVPRTFFFFKFSSTLCYPFYMQHFSLQCPENSLAE